MGDNKNSGFLDHLKGALFLAFSVTPLGMRFGMGIQNNPHFKMGLIEGAKDTARDAYFGLTYAGTLGDGYVANKAADEFEQLWRKHATPQLRQEHTEFRMAVGWRVPKGTLYNGVALTEQTEVSKMSAIFIKNKNGSVEIMDHNDPRYGAIAFPYLLVQLGSPVFAGKALGALTSIKALSKGLSYAGYTASATHGGGMGVFAGHQVYDGFVLKPESIVEIAGLMQNPANLSVDKLRDKMNKIFENFAYLNGPNSEQYYLPLLRPNESPFSRLEGISKGYLTNIHGSKHPFDRITDLSQSSSHFIPEVKLDAERDAIKKNLHFRKGYYELCLKAISGANLTESENIMLRFGMNLNGEIFPLVKPDGKSFSQAETLKLLYTKLGFDWAANNAEKALPKDKTSKDAALATMVQFDLSQVVAEIAERERPKNSIIQSRVDNPFAFN